MATTLAQGTAFTYQGQLNDGAAHANGSYDLRFVIYDSSVGGVQVGPILTNAATPVSNGLFMVTLDFGDIFPGANRFLELAVRTNGGTFTTLSPRQPLTASPYAITAGNVASGAIAGTFTNAVSFNNGVNTFTGRFTGNGENLTGVDAVTLGGFAAFNFWQLGGNTVASGEFLGSLNNRPLDFRVNNERVLRFTYASNAANGLSPNIVAGYRDNFLSNGIVGATVLGGGTAGLTNRVLGSYGTVVGGLANVASGDISVAMGRGSLAYGFTSLATGFRTSARGDASTAMGNQSVASGDASVAMGLTAVASGFASSALGQSTASNSYATAMGYTSVAGGVGAVAGGYGSRATGDHSTALGASEANGFGSTAMGDSIAANTNSTALGNSIASGNYATAVGLSGATGRASLAAGESTATGGSSVALGRINKASGFAATALGANGIADGDYSVALGLFCNASNMAAFALGTGAKANHAGCFVWSDETDGTFTTFSSTAANQFLVHAGGGVGIGTNSPAGALHVASPLSSPQIQMTQANPNDYSRLRMNVGSNPSWEIDLTPGATPRLEFWNSTRRMYVDYNGNVTATSFNPTSDRNAKENFQPVNSREVLDQVAALPLTKWNFKDDSATKHIGPMAQDFYAAFGVGPDDKHIATVDADGIALAAIQGLNQKLADELKRRDAENAELKARIGRLENFISKLAQKSN